MTANPQAPVCHVVQNEIITQPQGPTLMSIPAATDLASALAAIAALAQNVRLLSGQIGRNGANGASGRGVNGGVGPRGFAGSAGRAAPTNTRWAEQSRQTQTKTITDSTGQFSVTIQQITSLNMVDSVTGESWGWKL